MTSDTFPLPTHVPQPESLKHFTIQGLQQYITSGQIYCYTELLFIAMVCIGIIDSVKCIVIVRLW